MPIISRPPQRVVCDASNKPASSATAFNLSASGVTGFVLPVNSGEVVSGRTYKWLAEEIDGDGNPSGAWQTFYGVYTDAATDTISQATLDSSSTGSFIDWSGTGVDALARISAIADADGKRVHSSGTLSSDTYITIGGATEPFEVGKDYRISIDAARLSVDGTAPVFQFYVGGAWVTASEYHSASYAHYNISGFSSGVKATFGHVGPTNSIPPGNDTTAGAEELYNAVLNLPNPANPDGHTTVHTFVTYHRTTHDPVGSRNTCQLLYPRAVLGIRIYPLTGVWDFGDYVCWEIDR